MFKLYIYRVMDAFVKFGEYSRRTSRALQTFRVYP